MALGLSDNGAVVTVLARRKDRLDAVVEELHQVPLCFAGESVCVSQEQGKSSRLIVASSVSTSRAAWSIHVAQPRLEVQQLYI